MGIPASPLIHGAILSERPSGESLNVKTKGATVQNTVPLLPLR